MPDVRKLRVKLIAEELLELCAAFGIELSIMGGKVIIYRTSNCNLAEAYDATLDLLVVTIGTANAMGLDIEPGWQEVIRSNNTKFIDGHRREDGKWVKGPSYSPAQLGPIIEAQMA